MTAPNDPYENLKKIFHEPNRLKLMSALSARPDGATFNDLKQDCGLTDGNLNRHLKVLQEVDAVEIKKKFVGLKPRTTVYITDEGLDQFRKYLDALNEVLIAAQEAMPTEKKTDSILNGKTVRA